LTAKASSKPKEGWPDTHAKLNRARAHQENWQPQRNRNFRELLSAGVEHMLLIGAAQFEESALLLPQYALLRSATCVQLRLITILGNCGCVAVASFLGVSWPLYIKELSKVPFVL
jgi:hypothetical protein